MRGSALLLAAALGAVAAAPSRPPPALPVSPAFALDPGWDDGKAELVLYATTGEKYGSPRRYESRIILVKEDFVKGTLVKSDAGPVPGRTFEVLKMNYLYDIPTGTYTYHQMVSVYFDRKTYQPVKLAMSSMESCGLTFVEAKPKGVTLSHVSHSYWDQEGDRALTLPWGPDAVFYDALPVWLRALDLTTPATYRVRLLPTQLSSHVSNTALVPAEIEVLGHTGAPSETSRGGLEVVLRAQGKEDHFMFHPGPGHVLLVWEKADGTTLTLRKNVRLAYWDKHAPGDEKLLE